MHSSLQLRTSLLACQAPSESAALLQAAMQRPPPSNWGRPVAPQPATRPPGAFPPPPPPGQPQVPHIRVQLLKKDAV